MTYAEVQQENIEVAVKKFESFRFYSIESFYVIAYFGSYESANKQKVYKSWRKAYETWNSITNGTITYYDF